MRRMLTETEVEKLDSIKPSEIEKLGKITNADIESVQAMQSPKNAKANQVLTADGTGKAVYKDASGGTQIRLVFTSKTFYKEWFERDVGGERLDRTKFPGYKVAKDSAGKYMKLCREGFPYYVKPDGSKVFIAPTDFFIMDRKYNEIILGVKDAVFEQFVADTTGMSNAAIELDMNGYYGYDQ